MLTRRRLLERLGLGASAPLLAGIADQLIGRALGATTQRRCAVFIVLAEALPAQGEHGYVPKGIDPGKPTENNKDSSWSAMDTSNVTLPAMFEPLTPWRDKLVMVDGLYNDVGEVDTGHGTGYGALSGLRPGAPGPEFGGPPQGITLDQFIAQRTGRDVRLPSLLAGSLDKKDGQGVAAFAAGPGQPVPHCARPSRMYAQLMGQQPAPTSDADAKTAALLRTKLLESMRDDVRRLRAELASEERALLDTHLASIDEFDRRTQQGMAGAQMGCNLGAVPSDPSAPEDRLESMMAMGALALRCGLTNVFGVSIGVNGGHNKFRGWRTTPDYTGHLDYALYAPQVRKLYVWLSQQIAKFLTALGPTANETIVTIVPSHGASFREHHSCLSRWPVFIWDGTGTFRTGARYLRYGRKERSVIDLYSTIAHAAGAPTDKFGAGGANPSKGPLGELMR